MEKLGFHSGICRLRQARQPRPQQPCVPQNGRISRQYRGGKGPARRRCRRRTSENAVSHGSEPSPFAAASLLACGSARLRARRRRRSTAATTRSRSSASPSRGSNFDSHVDARGLFDRGRGLGRRAWRLLLRHDRQAHRLRALHGRRPGATAFAPNTAMTKKPTLVDIRFSRRQCRQGRQRPAAEEARARTGCRSSRPTCKSVVDPIAATLVKADRLDDVCRATRGCSTANCAPT